VSLSLLQALKYRSLDTPIHRLDPRVKLLFSASLLAAALVFNNYWAGMLTISTLIVLLQVVLLAFARSARYLFTTVRGAAPLVAIVFALSMLGTSTPPTPFFEALYIASASSVRFLAFLTSFNLFFLTTSPDEFGQLLMKLRIPYEYTFTFVAAVRLAPIIADEAQEIIDAQRSRGVEFEGGSIARRLRALAGVFVPLLVNSLRRAYEMAEALEVKCFGASKRRTFYRELRATGRDVAVSIVIIAFLTAAIYARLRGITVGLP